MAGKKIFFSYSHEDKDLRDQLANHLKILERENLIECWHDRQIPPSTEWKRQIDHHLQQAQIILMLVSKDFFASDYIWEVEMKFAMERCRKGDANVIPVILRPCEWELSELGKLQAVPENRTPVTSWTDPEEAFRDIARKIRELVERSDGPRPFVGALQPFALEGPHSTSMRNCVLIRNDSAFNKRLLTELSELLIDSGSFPYEESPKYRDRETNAKDFRDEWRNFLDSDSEVLFTIYPENVRWTTGEIEVYIKEISDKKKKVVFFESGLEFARSQDTLSKKNSDLTTYPVVYVLQTDYSHAMEGIWEVAMDMVNIHEKRNLVIASLMPDPKITPPAKERGLVIDRHIRNIVCYRHFYDGGKYALCQEMEDILKERYIYRFNGDVTFLHSYTKSWRIGEAQEKAKIMKKVMEYAEENEACLLVFAGNDDMAFACYEASPDTFKQSGYGILAGFDGFPDTPFYDLRKDGHRVISAQVNLASMCKAAHKIIKRENFYSTPFSANILEPITLAY